MNATRRGQPKRGAVTAPRQAPRPRWLTCDHPSATPPKVAAIAGLCASARLRYRGMALPGALLLASMMLTTSAVWLEASIAHRRYGSNVHEHLRATQAANGALSLCARDLGSGVAPVLPAGSRGPVHWTHAETFDSPWAYEPVPSWPGSIRAPQCVIEMAQLEGNSAARAYWITARGFGAAQSSQAWLQLMVVREAGRERRAWRRIVATPGAG